MKFFSIIFSSIIIGQLSGTEIRPGEMIIDLQNKTGVMAISLNFKQEYIRVDSIKLLETDAVLNLIPSKTPLPFYLTPGRTEIIYFENFPLEELADVLNYEIFHEEGMIGGKVKVKTAEISSKIQAARTPIELVIPIWAGLILLILVVVILVTSISRLKKKLTIYTSEPSSPNINEIQNLFESRLSITSNQLERSIESIFGEIKKIAEVVQILPQSSARMFNEILDKREAEVHLKELKQRKTSIQHKLENLFKEIQKSPNLTISKVIHSIEEKSAAYDISLLTSYLEAGRKWDELMREWNQFLKQPELQVEYLLKEQYWESKVDGILAELNNLPKELPTNSFLPLFDQIWKDTSLQAEKGKLLEFLKLEEVIPPVNKLLDETTLKDYETVKSVGSGRHLYVAEVISSGYRRKDNRVWVKKPKIKVEAR